MGDRLGATLAMGREGTGDCGFGWPSLDRGKREHRRGAGEGGWRVAGAGGGRQAADTGLTSPLGTAPQKESPS